MRAVVRGAWTGVRGRRSARGGRVEAGPRRVRRRRGRGRALPPDAVDVGRSTVWGNPFWVTRSSPWHGISGSWYVLDATGGRWFPDGAGERAARQLAVDLFTDQVLQQSGARVTVEQIRAELVGRDLACWCGLDQPCHADVLLRIANSTDVLSRSEHRAPR